MRRSSAPTSTATPPSAPPRRWAPPPVPRAWTSPTLNGELYGEPLVYNDRVYVATENASVYALDADTGAVIWRHQLSDYGLPAGTVSRTSPAVQDHTVYIGTQAGAFLLAINAKTGDLRWKTQLDIQSGAVLTASPAVLDDVIHIGVSGVAQEVAVE